jgi:CRP-like cAMP-binding protein
MANIDVRGSVGETSPLARLLSSYVALNEHEIDLLEGALGESRIHSAGSEIRFGDGAAGRRPLLVAAGWAAEAALMGDGRRQIVGLAIPGDLLDPAEIQNLGLTVVAVTAVRTLDASRLSAVMAGGAAGDRDQLMQAWRLSRRARQARLVRHIVRLGRMSAYDRLADFFLELHERELRAGLADRRTVSMPLTQEALADHLGLSIVHVNRTLQQLRHDDLIEYQGGRVTLRDPDRLADIAGRPAG